MVAVLSVGVALASCSTGGRAPSHSTSTTQSLSSTTTEAPVTTIPPPAHAVIGQSVTVQGISLTVSKVLDPLQLGPNTELNPGQRAIGLDVVATNPSTVAQSQDIADGLTVYDTHGLAYEANTAAKLNGVPNFPKGSVTMKPGGSISGWLEVQLPTSAHVSDVVITLVGPSSQNDSATWAVAS